LVAQDWSVTTLRLEPTHAISLTAETSIWLRWLNW
jgi:hypothetical protein